MILLLMLSLLSVNAEEWALIGSSGTVVQVIVTTRTDLQSRTARPWIPVQPGKHVGIGWIYKGGAIVPPAVSVSTYAVASSTGTKKVK